MASGCISESEFHDRTLELGCDIQRACVPDATCLAVGFESAEDCARLDQDKAAECLEALEDLLIATEAYEGTQCVESIEWPQVCWDAWNTERCPDPGPVAGRRYADGGQPMLPGVRVDAAHAKRATRSDRQRAGVAWLEQARIEHASVRAFERLALELAALGAPNALVERARLSARQEAEHAQLCLHHANDLLPRPHALEALPPAKARDIDLRTLATEALLDGCLGEGVASLEALRLADVAADPYRQSCRQIAGDELEHAKLAWATLGWALRQQPSLARELDRQLARRRRRIARAEVATDLELDAFGVTRLDALLAGEAELLDEVVAPTLQRLSAAILSQPKARAF